MICGCGNCSPVFQLGECKLCWVEKYQPELLEQFPIASIASTLRPDKFPSYPSTANLIALTNNPQRPGTELKKLLSSFGIGPTSGCSCENTLVKMDTNGVQWCKDNLPSLVAEIQTNAKSVGWLSAFRALDKKKLVKDKEVVPRVLTSMVSAHPVLSAIRECIIIACERAVCHPEPLPPQPIVAALPRLHDQVQPMKRWRIDTARLPTSEAHFNASIVRWNNKTFMAYRLHWCQAKVHICELGNDGQPIRDIEIPIPRAFGNRMAVEDPRLFVFKGDLWLEVIGLDRASKIFTSVLLARLHKDLSVMGTFFPDYHPRREWEKNWGMFEYADELHAIYTPAPNHIVIKEDGRPGFKQVSSTPFNWPVSLGSPRGSCSPILFRNEWYNFVHCVMRYKGERWYSINLYTFENKPPFRPARILPFPLLLPDVKDRYNDSHPNVVFPGGAVRDGAIWRISYGYQDKHIEIAEWDGNWLERFLEPVKGGPYDGLSMEPGWHDIGVWRDVYTANDYGLPDRFHDSDIVVDVGGHIGSFASTALDRGAGKVISCEPMFVPHLTKNLAKYGDRAEIVPWAISGQVEDTCSCIDPYSNGCYSAKLTGDVFPLMVRLGDVLSKINGTVRLLKLDCEGPEFAIVEDTDLSRVQEIIGEVHPYRYNGEEFTFERFKASLERKGFEVTKAVRPGQTWLFWARRAK